MLADPNDESPANVDAAVSLLCMVFVCVVGLKRIAKYSEYSFT